MTMKPLPPAIPPLSRRGLLGLTGAAALAGAIPATAANGPAIDMSAAIDALIGDAMRKGGFPAMVVAVEKAGQVVYRRAFGLADVENGVAATPDHVFPIGSVTKTMTGLALMQLVAAGRLGLDDPVGRYVDGLPPPVAGLALRHLADHTSGLVGYLDVPGFPRDSQKPFTRAEVVAAFKDLPLQFTPGTRWSYTNSGIYLLGLVIEKVSGLSYEEYLAQNLFTPFGMAQSSMEGWGTVIQQRAHGYMPGRGGLRNAPRHDPLLPFAAGAVLSTVDDMLRYRRGVFGDGPTSGQVRELIQQRERLSSGTLLPYSMGCLAVTDFEGHRKLGHPGDIFGFSSQYAYYPDDDVTIIVLSNLQGGPLSIVSVEQKLARAVLGLAQPVAIDKPLTEREAARFNGRYEVGELRFAVDQLRFFYREGALYAVFGAKAGDEEGLPLRYQGGDLFVSALDDEHRFRFQGKGAKRQVLMSYYGSVFTASAV